MPLAAKRKTPTGEPPRAKSKVGAKKADSTSGPAKKTMNRPIAGLTEAQMTGGSPDEAEESKVAKKSPKKGKPKRKAAAKGSNPFGGY